MKLQSHDYISALQIQRQLAQLCPSDNTIKAFAAFLPAEAAEQIAE